ncbi:MAG: trypsin-like peptidase domain-containing protein [Bacteroidales bacterium]|nr:trypsin-like peptidase domain-containing protein [Bacteroidales bacterium]
MKKALKWIWGLIVTALVGYLAVDKYQSKQAEAENETQQEVEKIREQQRRNAVQQAPLAGGEQQVSFCDAAEMAVRSVVYVKVTKKAAMQAPSSILDYLFGFAITPKDQVGIGSGVIISEDGYIVTNNHVVSGGDEFEVTLYDNTVYTATLVGADPATDLALIKIDKRDCEALEMGDSDSLRLGEWVLAIGSPYDLRSTITAGIVSAKGRSFPNYDGQYRVESFIQTDAAVNPGNSGGALVNIAGQLVGINTSIISLTGSYAGYSFAVPVNIVRKVTDDFINFGQVQRAVLGISMRETEAGVVVEAVKEGSVAESAGIRKGDILREINFAKIAGASDLQVQMNKYRPGEKIVLTIEREGAVKEMILNL